jgi:hypothetical protein
MKYNRLITITKYNTEVLTLIKMIKQYRCIKIN